MTFPINSTEQPSYDNYRIPVPDMESISEGYAYSGIDDSGSLYASPDSYNLSNLEHFSSNLYDPTLVTSSPETVRYLSDEYHSTLNAAGVSSDPSRGGNFRPTAVETSGRQMYSTQNMITSVDDQLGSKMINSSLDVYRGFDTALGSQTFDDDELIQFQNISDNSQDPQVIAQLNGSKASGDSEGFIDQVFEFFAGSKTKVTTSAAAKGQGPKGDESKSSLMDSLSTAFQAYALFEMWDYMGPAQKASGLATVGLKGYELSTGEKLGNKVLVNATLRPDGSQLTPALTLGNAVDLFSIGVNAYGLAKNWDQLSDVSKVMTGLRTVQSIASVAESMNLLGAGTTNAAVATSSASLAAAGFQSTPHLGVGAITGPASAGVPAGYTAVTYTDDLMMASIEGGKNVVAVPTANAATAQGVQTGAGSMLNTAVGAAGVAYGAYQLYEGWGTGGAAGATNGAVGGATMAAGLYTMGYANPYVLAAIVVVSALSGLVKTGKEEGQVKRDGVRARFKEVGIVNDNWSITLGDGTKADIGADGSTGQYDWLDPEKAKKYGGDTSKRLNAYDVDYTNDVAFMASMGGTAISRIISGGSATNVDQMGGQLANAFISNVDSADGVLTEEKFRKVMANERTLLAKAGVRSRADAFALANQLYAEDRIDDFQLVQMHQAFNMMYRYDNWEYAQQLLVGRWKGVEVANEKKDIPEKDKVTVGEGEKKKKAPPEAAPAEEEEAALA